MGAFEQAGFAARFDWGEAGLRTLAPHVEVLVIVDVLSFSTCVEVATTRGAFVYPRGVQEGVGESSLEHTPLTAVHRLETSAERPFSLSPKSLMQLQPGTRIVLPSLNGSHLTRLAGSTGMVVAGCLRNARAVAAWAKQHDCVGVLGAGELRRDGTLRFAIEDLIGAGAILNHFSPEARSPEAEVAVAAFERFACDLPRQLAECGSGRELVGMGFAEDVAMAAELDVSTTVPRLIELGWYAAMP